MKKYITLWFMVLAGLLSAQTVSIQGGSSYPTIAEAITAAVDGDVILISGMHTESITVNKSVTLRGENPATDIIQAAAAPSSTGAGSRVVFIGAPAVSSLNVTIENLTIRHGNASANGGGIFVDKVIGMVHLNNLVITNNHTSSNGGAISFAGSNANMLNCVVQNNTSTLDGGGIIVAPNNASGASNVVTIKQSLINANTGRNGGAIFLNGNNGFGNNYKIDLNIENSTISNNNTTSPASGNGGGAIFTAGAFWTTVAGGDGTTTNTSLKLVHVTIFNNAHAAPLRAGLRFAGVAGTATNFSAYNSIIVANNDVNVKALNFQNTNTTNVVNCILGGLENAPLAIVDDPTKNNLKGRTATQAGLSGTLSNLGGATSVLDIIADSNAINYCTAGTGGEVMPTTDQRGYNREGVNDAGAFELGGTLGGPSPTTTVIASEDCGSTIVLLAYELINAVAIPNAQAYEFKIENGSFTSTFVSTNGTVRMMDFAGVQYNTTYDISVRVMIDDSYGSYGASCEISTTATPVTTIQSPVCGSTLANIATPINAFALIGAEMYEFEVTDVSSSTVQTIERTSRAFALTMLPNVSFGTEYSVAVRAKFGGVWMPFGAACTLFTPAPLTQMRATYCGVTVESPNSLLYANSVLGATLYEFEVTNTSTNAIEVIPSTTPTFRFNELANFQFGITYSIRVRAQVNDTFSAYGAACTISTPLPTSQLRAVSCNTTLPNINSLIFANGVPFAVEYTFEVTNASNNVVEEVVSSVPNIRLSMLSEAPLANASYAVRVKVKVGDTYGLYGVSCTVMTPVLVTSVRDSQCGTTLAANTTPIYANSVFGAMGYRFEITITSTNEVEVIDREVSIVNLGFLENIVTSGTTYSIRVSALVGTSYIPYGPACTVTTPGVQAPVARVNAASNGVHQVITYPNPFTESFTIKLPTDAACTIDLFDSNGRRVETINVQNTTEITLGSALVQGVYFVNVEQNGKTKHFKMVKK